MIRSFRELIAAFKPRKFGTESMVCDGSGVESFSTAETFRLGNLKYTVSDVDANGNFTVTYVPYETEINQFLTKRFLERQ